MALICCNLYHAADCNTLAPTLEARLRAAAPPGAAGTGASRYTAAKLMMEPTCNARSGVWKA